jgi:hypothetical protein
MLKLQEEISRWEMLIAELKGANAAKCFTIRESKAAEVKEEERRATSRLVLRLAGSYQDLVSGDLVFELRWRQVVRPAFPRGSAAKADWELSDVQEVSVSKEKSPGE